MPPKSNPREAFYSLAGLWLITRALSPYDEVFCVTSRVRIRLRRQLYSFATERFQARLFRSA